MGGYPPWRSAHALEEAKQLGFAQPISRRAFEDRVAVD